MCPGKELIKTVNITGAFVLASDSKQALTFQVYIPIEFTPDSFVVNDVSYYVDANSQNMPTIGSLHASFADFSLAHIPRAYIAPFSAVIPIKRRLPITGFFGQVATINLRTAAGTANTVINACNLTVSLAVTFFGKVPFST
jgi:hypothetical protein